jgi:hypothetical protein
MTFYVNGAIWRVQVDVRGGLTAMHQVSAAAIGWSIGATLLGLISAATGIAYFVNFKRIAEYTHRRTIYAWASAPGRYFAPRVARREVRLTRLAYGWILVTFGTIALFLGVYSLAVAL